MDIQRSRHSHPTVMTLTGEFRTLSYTVWKKKFENLLKKERPSTPITLKCDEALSWDASVPLLMARMIQSQQDTYSVHFEFDTSTLGTAIQQHLVALKTKQEAMGAPKTHEASSIESLGHTVLNGVREAQAFLSFMGEVIVGAYQCLTHTQRFSIRAFFMHMNDTGLQAFPIIALISFLIGMVLTYQGINQLLPFGAEIYTVDFLALGVFRELGVLLTAVVVAGRSSSAYTAHIGIMALNQEVDALRVMNINPIVYLVLPRIAAIIVVLPLLVFLSDVMALVGGMLITSSVIQLSPIQFMHQLQQALTLTIFFVGMSKAPLFALIIGCIGCFRGLCVRYSAESVGKQTTRSVVEAIFYVIICNAVMSLVYSYLKI